MSGPASSPSGLRDGGGAVVLHRRLFGLPPDRPRSGLPAQLGLRRRVFRQRSRASTPSPSPVARRFGALWLGSLAAMMLVLVSNNLGIMWVGMEATTLLSAFLISLHPSRLSLEAMWKYLIICSVGIAFAFIGTIVRRGLDPDPAAAIAGGRAVLDQARLRRRPSRPDPDEIRVHLHSGRLRHEDRARADPLLAARCAQPGADPGFGDVLRLSA